ncbi:MAG: class I SAM-dependent methyltransferase [Opitutae bacterium]|nr:class I SAM-dependent methyltransferase [Opitutae bacterium]
MTQPTPLPPDSKQGERDYYSRIGPEGIKHALAKPFSDDHCAHYLASMTALFSLLPPPPARLVEFGCGTGWLSLDFARRGYDVLGVDIAEDAVRLARAEATAYGITKAEFLTADYESFDGGAAFDAAVFHDALHHAEDELAALRCAYAALRVGGCVIVLEPGSGHATAPAALHAVAEYGVHEKSMPPAHILRVARQAGFIRHLVLPQPHQLLRMLYRQRYHQGNSTKDLLGLRILSILRSIQFLLRWRWDPGLVLLWK